MFARLWRLFAGRHFQVQGITRSQRLPRFDGQLPTQFARHAVAQPEGEGVRLAVQIALGLVEIREVQIVDLVCRDAVASIQNTEGQTIAGRLVLANVEGDLADRRGGH